MSEVKTVVARQLLERQGDDAPMSMPFEPFERYRDLDRRADEMSSQRRDRTVPVDAYRRGDELKVELDGPPPRPRLDRGDRERPPKREGDAHVVPGQS